MRKIMGFISVLAAVGCAPQDRDDVDTVAEAVASNLGFPADQFGMVTISAGNALQCTGTLIRANLVLTATSCVASFSPASLTVATASRSQSTTGRVVNNDPFGNGVAVILLRGSITAATPRALAAAAPAASSNQLCLGFGGGGGLTGADFAVRLPTTAANAMLEVGRPTTGSFVAGDLGASCQDDSNAARPISLVVKALGSCGGAGCGTAVAVSTVRAWLDDMLHMADVAAQNWVPIEIQSLFDGKCMDLPWGEYVNNGPVNQFTCTQTGNQLWFLDSAPATAGSYDWHRIVSARTGLCLTAAANGALQQSRCGSGNNQIFDLQYQQDAREGNLLRPRSAWFTAVDIPGFSRADSQALQLYSVNFGDNQRWWLIFVFA